MTSWRQVGLLLLLLLCLALRGVAIQREPIELDEFEHLHAGYLVASGQVPYQDFFQMHTPLFYFVAGQLIDPVSANFDTVLSFRWLSLAAHVAVLGLAAALAWQSSRAAGMLAVVFLLTEIFSFAWGSLVFLDSFATPLIVLSALLLVRAPRGRGAHLMAGILLGTAVMLTQKAVFPALAPVVLALLRGRKDKPSDLGWFEALARLAFGAALPCIVMAVAVGTEGLLSFWHNVLVLSTTWKARRWPLGEAFLISSYSLPMWLLAGIGVLALLRQVRDVRSVSPAVLTPVVYLFALLSGIFLLPVVWYEYFVEIGPFVAVIAAITVVDAGRLMGWLRGRLVLLPANDRWALACGGSVLAGTMFSLALRLGNAHYSPSPTAVQVGVTIVFIAAVLLAASRWVRLHYGEAAVGALVVAACALPITYQLTWLDRPGLSAQRRAVQEVMTRVGPESAVFDGYSGYGVFRPHAYPYWLLHDEMITMLTPDQRSRQVLDVLRDTRVKVAIRDEFSRLLPQEVQQFLDDHFEPVPGGPVWVRRDPSAG